MTAPDTSSTPPSANESGAGLPPRGDYRGPRRGLPLLAAILVGVGAFLALRHSGLLLTDRWWTAFLLIPAGALLVASIRAYRAAEGWTGRAIGTLVGGLVLMGLWGKLFFGWSAHAGGHAAAWGGAGWHMAPFHGHFLFPLIVLVVGVALLMRRARWQR